MFAPLSPQLFGKLKRQSSFIWKAYEINNKLFCSDLMARKAALVKDCASVVTFKEYESGECLFHQAFFCKDRFCSLCSELRFRSDLFNLDSVIRYLAHVFPKSRYLFITLTVKDILPDDLCHAVSDLGRAWSLLQKRLYRLKLSTGDPFFLGFHSVLEITYNFKKDGLVFHPHLHIIAQTSPGYLPIVKSKSGKSSHAVYHYEYFDDGSRARIYDDQLSKFQLEEAWRDICSGFPLFDGSHIVHIELCGSDRLLRKQLEKDGVCSKSFVPNHALGLAEELVKGNRYDFSKKLVDYCSKGVTKLHDLEQHPEPLYYMSKALRGCRVFRPSGSFRSAFKLLGTPDFPEALRLSDRVSPEGAFVILIYIFSYKTLSYELQDS